MACVSATLQWRLGNKKGVGSVQQIGDKGDKEARAGLGRMGGGCAVGVAICKSAAVATLYLSAWVPGWLGAWVPGCMRVCLCNEGNLRALEAIQFSHTLGPTTTTVCMSFSLRVMSVEGARRQTRQVFSVINMHAMHMLSVRHSLNVLLSVYVCGWMPACRHFA